MVRTTTIEVEGRSLRVTNLDKVIYPATGTTKGDVLDYYLAIAPTMIPHVAGRPVTRKRWVHGVGTASAPRAVMTAAIAERVLEVRPPEAVVVRASWERVAECLSMSAPFGAWCERTRSDAVRSHDFVFVSPVWGDCVSPVGVTSLR